MKNMYDEKVEKFFESVDKYVIRMFDENYLGDDRVHVIGSEESNKYLANCASCNAPVQAMCENWKLLRENRDANIKQVELNNSMFTAKNSNDYRVYFACLYAYHTIIRYYRYNAVYNMKDAELQSALDDWYKAVSPKVSIFSKVFQKHK